MPDYTKTVEAVIARGWHIHDGEVTSLRMKSTPIKQVEDESHNVVFLGHISKLSEMLGMDSK